MPVLELDRQEIEERSLRLTNPLLVCVSSGIVY